MRTYEEVYRDWEILWNIGPADDMTGGYVDQEDLAALLKNPTKKTAKSCLESQIGFWFQQGPDTNSGVITAREASETHPEVIYIAEKYGHEDRL